MCLSGWTGYFSGFQLLTQISFASFFIIFITQSELTVPLAGLVYVWYRCVHVFMLSLQLCPTLCDPIDCSPSSSSVHGISQARILERVASPYSRGPFQLRDRTCSSCAGRQILYHWATWEALEHRWFYFNIHIGKYLQFVPHPKTKGRQVCAREGDVCLLRDSTVQGSFCYLI